VFEISQFDSKNEMEQLLRVVGHKS